MKILVTGAGGMLGAEFVRELKLSKNHEVSGVRRQDCDLTDKDLTQKMINRISPDLIIHCAAVVGGIAANIAHPINFLMQNLMIDTSVFSAALASNVKNFVYIGSSCMYPKDLGKNLTEKDLLTAPLEPTNEGYALAKISGSKLTTFIAREKGLNYRTIIPSNLYGPGDEFSEKSSHLVAATLLKAHDAKISNLPEIEVWGNGEARREFTYIGDLSKWLVSQLPNLQNFPEILNVGAGVDHSIDDYYKTALTAVGYEAKLKHDLTKPVGMSSKLMDSSLAKSNFDWNPTTTLLDGMKITYKNFLGIRDC